MAFIRGISGETQASEIITVEGLSELQAQLDQLSKVPKTSLTKAAKAGVNPIVTTAKSNAAASKKTGMMVRGIKAVQETPRKRNKSVYFINWWKKYSDVYRKPIKRVGLYGGKNQSGYYPQSIEWGFKTKHGKKAGKYYVRDAIAAHQAESLQKVIDVLSDELDKLI